MAKFDTGYVMVWTLHLVSALALIWALWTLPGSPLRLSITGTVFVLLTLAHDTRARSERQDTDEAVVRAASSVTQIFTTDDKGGSDEPILTHRIRQDR